MTTYLRFLTRGVLGLAMVCMSVLALTAATSMAADYPDKPVELRAAGSPGGGLDLLARSIEQALVKENLFKGTLTIANQGGGGGNPARAYLKGKKGSGYVMLCESNRVYLNPIMGTTDMTIDDFTPIARIATEYLAVAVRADSKYKTWQDIADVLKKDPKGVSIGVGTVPSNDQINVLRAAKASGVDPAQIRVVAFRSGGDLLTQLLGGHVDMISTGLSECLPQAKNGDIRILAISSPERLGGDMRDLPTWKDQGINVAVFHWRGIFGPPQMPQNALDYWVNTFAKMIKTPTWQQICDRTGWFTAFIAGKEFTKDVKEEAAEVEDLLRRVGMVKK